MVAIGVIPQTLVDFIGQLRRIEDVERVAHQRRIRVVILCVDGICGPIVSRNHQRTIVRGDVFSAQEVAPRRKIQTLRVLCRCRWRRIVRPRLWAADTQIELGGRSSTSRHQRRIGAGDIGFDSRVGATQQQRRAELLREKGAILVCVDA